MAVTPPRTVTPPNHVRLPDDESYRRRSFARTWRVRGRRGATDSARLSSASPEVISSLISSLDAISNDTRDHCENLPNSNGALPTAVAPPVRARSRRDSEPTTLPPAQGRKSGVDYGVFSNPQSNDIPYIDDAAEPPVVRTSKPPSGFSQLTAPTLPKQNSGGSLKSYLRSTKSSNSLHLRKKDDRVADLDAARTTIGSRDSSASRLSRRGLTFMSSRERLRASDSERRRVTSNSPVADRNEAERHDPSLVTNPQLRAPSPRRPVLAETTIQEEASSPQQPQAVNSTTETESPKKAGKRKMERIEPSGQAVVKNHALIPERNSSLHHPHSPRNSKIEARRSSRRSSLQHKPSSSVGSTDQSVAREKPPPNETEEEKVTRRIRELKAQKEKRMRESGSGPALALDQGSKRHANTSKPTETGDPAIDSKILLDPEAHERQSRVKARKMLGIPVTPPQSPHLGGIVDKVSPSEPRFTRQPNAAPSTIVNSLEPDSPGFLAEYNRALDLLMGKPNPDTASSSPKSPGYEQHRKAADIVTLPERDSSKRHRWTQSENTTGPRDRALRNSVRNDLISVRKASMEASVGDGRPSSIDSIDLAVDDFLRAPRLSQKAKHPQTGRVITFSEVGDPKGYVVFCCVGMGLTRFITAFYDELATTLKLRLITPDRPGIGGSEAYTDDEGTPLSWPGKCRPLKPRTFMINTSQMTCWRYAKCSRSTSSRCSPTRPAPSTPSRPRSAYPNTSADASTSSRRGSRHPKCPPSV